MPSVTLEVDEDTGEPPRWARLERELIDRTNDAVDPVIEQYVREDGSVMWPPADDYEGIDAVDDVYEGFWNWPLFYALGGGRAAFEYAMEEFEAITAQFAGVPTGLGHPQIVREYQQGHDWFHQSEGYLLFYHLCMAAPGDERLRELATRFAGFYCNEDENVPDNYDFEHDLLYCPMNGSMGPAYHNFSDDVPPPMYDAHSETRVPWQYSEWKEHYGLAYYDLEGIDEVEDLKDGEKARRMGEAIRDRCAHSDTPQNLGATGMVANAFLLSGEERYREWVADYVDAWRERTARNDGVLPDNVDHDDRIGGSLDGRWYGGWYGWTWPHGWRSLGPVLAGAAETALTLTGDESYLELPRSQLTHLIEKGRESDGTYEIPYRYATAGALPRERGQDPDAEAGWFQYGPVGPSTPTHLWHASMGEADRNRLDRLVAREEEGELRHHGKHYGGNGPAWADYLAGERPGYPEEILEHNLEHVADRRAFLREDDQDPSTYGDWYLQERNPVVVEGLIQLTTGAPQVLYNGGISVGTVRHFDPERERPGLPPGVAALVTDLDDGRIGMDLVNTDSTGREVLVQAGGYAEHAFTDVAIGPLGGAPRPADGRSVGGSAVSVRLGPGATTSLAAGLDRHAGTPTYAFPWQR
jgi:hypothetical protein